MMRPVSVALPPKAASNLTYTITGNGNNRRLALAWNDNSISETAFLLQKTLDGTTWTNAGTSPSPLTLPDTNTTGTRNFTDPAGYSPNTAIKYQVVAQNTIGYGGQFPSMTATSVSAPLIVGTPPAAPTRLTATLQAGPQVRLTFTDNAINEVGFLIERSINGGAFVQIARAPARSNTGSFTYVAITVAAAANSTYSYRVAAMNVAGQSAYAVSAPVLLPATPTAPGSLAATNGPNGTGNNRTVILAWQDLSNNETGFTIQRATNATFTAGLNTANVGTGVRTLTQTRLALNTQYWYRIRANNGTIVSSAWLNATPLPLRTNR